MTDLFNLTLFKSKIVEVLYRINANILSTKHPQIHLPDGDRVA